MAGQPKALLSWSSGKDSAWTLHILRTQHGAVGAQVGGAEIHDEFDDCLGIEY